MRLDATQVWNSYIVAQLAHAALGSIPPHVRQLGLVVSPTTVLVVVIGLARTFARDDDAVANIFDEFADLVGPDVEVDLIRLTDSSAAPPTVQWIYRRVS